MTPSSSRVRIFVGEPVRYESERLVLNFVHEHLSQRSEWAYLFANFNVDGAQVDLLIATERNTLVVEAKTYTLPVRGGLDGPWELIGSARPRPTRNAYVQALAAKNALRDVMLQHDAGIGYPDAAVCIPKGVPGGSAIPAGDFKVGIGSLDELVARLDSCRGCSWDLALWEKVISSLRLQEVTTVDGATSPDYVLAQETLARYREAFLAFYDSGDRYVPDKYRRANEMLDFGGLNELVEQSQGVLIRGPSGCGKSLVARRLALAHLRRGGIPLFIGAKRFDGTLRRSLDGEIGLLDTASSAALLRAGRISAAPLLLVVDGCNECDEGLAVALARGVAAFASRYGASTLLTSQTLPDRADLLSLAEVTVEYPSLAMKRELANVSPSDASAAAKFVLLESVASGLEAVLVGEVGGLISGTSSRSALYDAYVRFRLGPHAFDGVRFLCALAKALVYRASSRISVRELDRMLVEERIALAVAQQMESTNLILRRANQVSFGHELFFASFAAEGAVRDAGSNGGHLLKALASPRFHAARALIVGAIEDQALLQTVLEGYRDPEVYVACIKGECGLDANRTQASG